MPSPPIQVFLTTIASQPALRQRQEYILRILQVKKIPFKSYDLASDEAAKKIWRRKAPPAKQQLPGMLVGGVCPGTYDDFEEAVEYDELDTYLRLKESWNEEDDYSPSLEVKPVGVPGASSPSQMTNHRPSFAAVPAPLKDKSKAGDELDAGDLLEDNSLVGVSVTDDELADLVKELGLEGDEAGDLVKGLSSTREPEPEPAPQPQPESETKPPPAEKKTDTETPVTEDASDALENEPVDPRIVTIEVQSDRNLAKSEENEK